MLVVLINYLQKQKLTNQCKFMLHHWWVVWKIIAQPETVTHIYYYFQVYPHDSVSPLEYERK